MRFKRGMVAATIVAVMVLGTAGTVVADHGIGTNIVAGPLCVGDTVTAETTAHVRRSPTGPQYPNSAVLTFSVRALTQPTRSTVTATVTEPTVALPADWTSQVFPFEASDTVSWRYTVTANEPGAFDIGFLDWTVSVNGGPPEPAVSAPITISDTTDCTPPDTDGDGVLDADDTCAGTVLPEPPPADLKKNSFAADPDGDFVDADGTEAGVSVADTGGCSGAQIIQAAGLGHGHSRYGITRGALGS